MEMDTHFLKKIFKLMKIRGFALFNLQTEKPRCYNTAIRRWSLRSL